MPPSPTTRLSILPFLVVGLGVILFLNLLRWGYESQWLTTLLHPQLPSNTLSTAAGLPQPKPQQGYLIPYRATVMAEPFNLQFGNPSAPYVLTIFTDPSCGPCRTQVAEVLDKTDTTNLRLVYKFWPWNPQDISGGIMQEVARRNNLIPSFFKSLASMPDTLSQTQMLNLLDKLGLPLTTQQKQLTEESPAILVNLGKDMALGQNLRLGTPPQFFLNDYKLDDRILPPKNLPLYLSRLEKGDPILTPTDYWLSGQ